MRKHGREELPRAQGPGGDRERQAVTAQEWLATSPLRSGVAAQKSYPVAKRSYQTPEARGGGREELSHVQGAAAAQAQEGPEELLHVQGQGGQP